MSATTRFAALLSLSATLLALALVAAPSAQDNVLAGSSDQAETLAFAGIEREGDIPLPADLG